MVYDWEGKEPVCYQMYIEEKKSLEEIMQYMREAHEFAPRYVTFISTARHFGDLERLHCFRPALSHKVETLVLLDNDRSRASRSPHRKGGAILHHP